MVGGLQLPFSVTELLPHASVAMTAARSGMATLPLSMLATCSPLGSNASCFLTVVGCCHGELVRIVKRAPLDSPQSGRHNIGDHKL